MQGGGASRFRRKKELTERIASYLDGGEIIADKPVARKKAGLDLLPMILRLSLILSAPRSIELF